MKKVDKKTLLPVMALVALTSVVLVGVLLYFVIMVSTLIPYDAYNDHPIANVIFVIILALILIGGFVFDIIAVAKTGEDVRASGSSALWVISLIGTIIYAVFYGLFILWGAATDFGAGV